MEKIFKKFKLKRLVGLLLAMAWATQAMAAQSTPIQIQNLEVELWPEFDRAETLVIYHVSLAPSVVLPVEVTFRLPGHIERMHVVAVEREGVLMEVSADNFQLRRENNELWLTLSTPVARIQFEYYDATLLTKQGTGRQLKFDYLGSYPVEQAAFVVQAPFQAENFALSPAPSSTRTGSDGLVYHALEIAGLAADEAFTLTASYDRASEALSAQNLASPNAEHAADLPGFVEPPENQNLALGYGLIGIGVVLLLGVGGYWIWTKFLAPTKTSQTGPAKAAAPASPPPANTPGNFCYRCGASLREAAQFCHKCGAERRQA